MKGDNYSMDNIIRFYAAYGSNTNIKQMKLRCPMAKVIGTGELLNYRLTFRGINNGVANIEFAKGRRVPIVLWEITKDCERKLDRYEGYPSLYIKRDFDIETKTGTIKAMAYVMVKQYETSPASPMKYYVNTIIEGYKDNNLSLDILGEALAENVNEVYGGGNDDIVIKRFKSLDR